MASPEILANFVLEGFAPSIVDFFTGIYSNTTAWGLQYIIPYILLRYLVLQFFPKIVRDFFEAWFECLVLFPLSYAVSAKITWFIFRHLDRLMERGVKSF